MKILLTESEIEAALKPVYDEILSAGKLLEIAPLLNVAVAKAQLKKVVEWIEPLFYFYDCSTSDCPIYPKWQALKKEANIK